MVGVIVGVPMGLGVSVRDGVGEDAEAVPVNIPNANWDSSVPMLSTGGEVGLLAHPVITSAKPSAIQFKKCVLIFFSNKRNREIYKEQPYHNFPFNAYPSALKGYKQFTVW
jgi:hypothetical protein